MPRVFVSAKYWIVGLIFVGVSVWVGLQIGLSRDWVAGIFVYVIPIGIILVLLLLPASTPRQTPVAVDQDIKEILQQVNDLKTRLAKLDELVDAVNRLEKSTVTPANRADPREGKD